MTKGMHGRGAEDLICEYSARVQQCVMLETGKVGTDLVEEGQEFVIAHGGRGGSWKYPFCDAS